MKSEQAHWMTGLRKYVDVCRIKNPVINRCDLSVEQEMQCRIIGGGLISWLNKYGPAFLQERAVLSSLMNVSKDPILVFTSTVPGMVAAREILADASESVVALFAEELIDWLTTNPDPEYRYYVHMWSFFANPDDEILSKAGDYPIGDGECYWLHKEGTMCGLLFGRGGDHLWKWDGKEATLLEEGVKCWVS
jgi:hypothetical protein